MYVFFVRAEGADDVMLSTIEIRTIALKIEEELYAVFQETGHKYKAKYRSLIFNIKDSRNQVLFMTSLMIIITFSYSIKDCRLITCKQIDLFLTPPLPNIKYSLKVKQNENRWITEKKPKQKYWIHFKYDKMWGLFSQLLFSWLQGLFRKILNGHIKPSELVKMTPDELASKELARWREFEAKHVSLSWKSTVLRNLE